ncbi:hypothetical protein N431DRAFT_469651 [Stipitochalara longipes BDJ]|nr:hypothetical protein N431DRAFT_469651 [Stipitochalara longipes BDJ]
MNSPLISRAWVVQERILSPRVIHFGTGQLGWECQEQEHCEIYPKGFPPSIYTLSLKNLDPANHHEDQSNIERRGDLSKIWSRIVRDYSKRNLTVESDKEAAISAIAARISRLRGNDTLVAGLWGRDLLKELCWQAGDFVVPPKSSRAPSWSWLSVEGCINVYERRSGEYEEIVWARTDEIQVNRTDHSPLAHIQNGRIRLRGTLKKIRWSQQQGYDLCDVLFEGLKNDKFYAVCDTSQAFENETAWCLLLYTYRTQAVSLEYLGTGSF